LSGSKLVLNIDALKDLNALQSLNLSGSQLRNVDGLKNLKASQTLNLSCQLRNVDGLRDLKALQLVVLRNCVSLSPAAVDDLRVALPQTNFVF
jgi:hypothetical protein